MDNSIGNIIGGNRTGEHHTDSDVIEREPDGRFKKGYIPHQYIFKKGNPGKPKGALSKEKRYKLKIKEKNNRKIVSQKETIRRLRIKISSLYVKLKAEKVNNAKKAMYDKIRLIKKPAKYYSSVIGFPIFRSWYIKNKLTPTLATILVVMSYHKFVLIQDLKLWDVKTHNDPLGKLTEMGLSQKIELPSKNGAHRKRHAYILSPKGLELMKSYEDYYNRTVKQLSGNKDPEEFDLKKTRVGNKKRKTYKNVISPIL